MYYVSEKRVTLEPEWQTVLERCLERSLFIKRRLQLYAECQ